MFGDPPSMQHEDRVGAANRGEAMGDRDGRPSSGEPGHGAEDEPLRLRIERCRRLVHQEDRGVADDGAGDRDALALARRQRLSALPDHRVVPIAEPVDELVGVGHPRRLHDLAPTGARTAVGNVLPDGRVEEHRILLHETHLVAQRLERVAPHVAAVDGEPAAPQVVQPRDERDERGLAAAGGPDERHGLPWFDHQRGVLQHRPVRQVAEARMVELDPPAEGWRRPGAGQVAHLALRFEQFLDPLERRRRPSPRCPSSSTGRASACTSCPR